MYGFPVASDIIFIENEKQEEWTDLGPDGTGNWGHN
jgi:hypothetical protein